MIEGGRGKWNVALKFWSISITWLSDMWSKETHVYSIFFDMYPESWTHIYELG